MNASTKFIARACTAVALCAAATAPALASHGRGAAIVPSVDANGLLTLDMKGFWRQQAGQTVCVFPHDCIGNSFDNLTVSGPGGFTASPRFTDATAVNSQDLTDTRRAEVNQTNNVQLSGAGTYTITWQSGAWQSGVDNLSSTRYGTESVIVWDGSTANAPITFDMESIQQEVVRGVAYSDNLDAVAGAGLSLSYGATTSGLTGVNQTYAGLPGYAIDGSGNVTISSVGTSSIVDNGSTGADVAFDGKISASDGSSVEFYWVFDGVQQGSNQTPDVEEIVLTVLRGTTVNETIAATDPNGDSVALSLTSFTGPGGIVGLGETFTDNGDDTGLFNWDTTGTPLGEYVAIILGNDGGLSDSGSIRITVIDRQVPNVPLPASVLMLGAAVAGLGGAGAMRRRRKS